MAYGHARSRKRQLSRGIISFLAVTSLFALINLHSWNSDVNGDLSTGTWACLIASHSRRCLTKQNKQIQTYLSWSLTCVLHHIRSSPAVCVKRGHRGRRQQLYAALNRAVPCRLYDWAAAEEWRRHGSHSHLSLHIRRAGYRLWRLLRGVTGETQRRSVMQLQSGRDIDRYTHTKHACLSAIYNYVRTCTCVCRLVMNLQSDVAGATFMAAGSSAPELFTSIVGQ